GCTTWCWTSTRRCRRRSARADALRWSAELVDHDGFVRRADGAVLVVEEGACDTDAGRLDVPADLHAEPRAAQSPVQVQRDVGVDPRAEDRADGGRRADAVDQDRHVA